METSIGRIRWANDNGRWSYVYDYYQRDHLGNVRTVLTEEKDTAFYPPASMETANIATERLYYSGVDSGRVNKSTVTGYPSDGYTNPNDYIQQLSGSGYKIGTGIVLKVMRGDQFNIRVSSWYRKNGVTPGTPTSPLNALISALISGVGGVTNAAHGATPTQLQSSGVLIPGATSFYGSHNTADSTTKPKAFLNWIFLDDQFKYVGSGSGFQQVGADTIFTVLAQSGVTAPKNGFLYVYVSNETPNINVYFDNLQVTHIKSPLLQEQSYYSFGLQMAGISDRALGKLDSKNKFDGGVNFEEDYGVNLYSTFFRNYDPQIGRFDGVDVLSERTFGMSVYGYCGNDPTMFIDPRGSEKAITQNEFDMMMESPNGGTWSASGGMELFGSQDEAFMFGALTYGGGGESGGGGGTFEQMLNRYNGGNLTSSLVAAYFKVSLGKEASDISAYEVAGGFNIGLTATSTGNHYSNEFNSTESILSAFNFLTTLYNGKENALFASNWEHINDAVGGYAEGLEYSSSTFRLTNGSYNNSEFSFELYESGWGGGSRAAITTYRVAAFGEGLGRASLATAVVLGAVDVYNGYKEDGGSYGTNAQLATGEAAGSIVGGWAGAATGAEVGAAVGAWFGGVGAVPGAIIGGIVGGIFGGIFGGDAGEDAVKSMQ